MQSGAFLHQECLCCQETRETAQALVTVQGVQAGTVAGNSSCPCMHFAAAFGCTAADVRVVMGMSQCSFAREDACCVGHPVCLHWLLVQQEGM